MTPTTIIFIIFGVWLSGLTALFYWMSSHYLRLVRGTSGGNLKKVLDEILSDQVKNKKNIADIKKHILEFEKDNLTHIQNFGLVRFNPFNDSGGDHSFCLALLDGHQNGFVLTGLHTRERTRIYVKPVKSSKSTYTLSVEEEKAIHEASKNMIQ